MSGTAGKHRGGGYPRPYVHPGGTGIAKKGFEATNDLWRSTLKASEECPCTDGCPSCVQSPKCDNNNQPLDGDYS